MVRTSSRRRGLEMEGEGPGIEALGLGGCSSLLSIYLRPCTQSCVVPGNASACIYPDRPAKYLQDPDSRYWDLGPAVDAGSFM